MAYHYRKLILILTLFLSFNCNALEEAIILPTSTCATTPTSTPTPIHFGHNLSPTTETLFKHQWTLGTYFSGVGISENLTFGFSPWIEAGYNLDNLILKYKTSFFKKNNSHQLAYFNTSQNFGHRYKQQSISYWLTQDLFEHDQYKMNLTMNYMYFWVETYPFSLRREPFNDQAQQFTLSSLHQFQFKQDLLINLELGALGLNYTYPNLIFGASVVKKWNQFSMQFGGSVTKRFSGELTFNQKVITSVENYLDTSLHPEIQLQYWF